MTAGPINTMASAACALVLTALVAVPVVTTASVPAASATAFPRNVRAACMGDARRLCPKHRLGSAEMGQCMEANGLQLSYRCLRALETAGLVPLGLSRFKAPVR
jgi:hypothetical protein